MTPDPDPGRDGASSKFDSPAEPVKVRPHDGVGGAGAGRGGQAHRPRQLRRQPRIGRCGEKPCGTGLLIGGQLRGSFERGTGGLVTTLGDRAPGGVVQRVNDIVVGFVDCGGKMPGPPIRVLPGGHHLGQCPMCLLPNMCRSTLIDSGTDKRVTETDLGTGDGQQPGFLGFCQRGRTDAEHFGGPPYHAHPGRIIGSGDAQQRLGLGGQPPAAVQEDPLHALGERQVHRQAAAAR